ncbi:MAG: hypothetical protein ABW321_08280 [Polyangiales bacterium]
MDERAESLRVLLVHLFFIDLDFDKRELAMLARVLPAGDVRAYVALVAGRRLDLARLASLFPDPDDRRDIVRLANHAVWGDAKGEPRELALLARLADALGVVPS